MPVTLPIEVYEVLEKNFGKDDAKKVIKSLESVIGEEVINKWHKTKEELREAILKEVPTKAELENVKIELLGEIAGLRNKTEKDKAELLGVTEKIQAKLLGRMDKDKVELLGEIAELRNKTERDKAELLGIIETTKAELIGKFQVEITRLDRKFTIMFVILFFIIVFLNQNALEFMARVLGLIK